MNGVTGRMGTNQHLMRSIVAIRKEGGLALSNGDRLIPDPILAGRDGAKLAKLAEIAGLERWSTDLKACLRNPDDTIYFDAQTTALRADSVRLALDAGKHVYCEKPLSTDSASALDLARHAESLGVKHGVVQDKLFLPGMLKLKRLIDAGFFGRILSIRGEFGYWVFEGDWQTAQRPSWNYRKEDGGGIIADMFCHWQYVLENLFGPVRAVSCLGATHIPERVDERGRNYECTADDAAYGTFELASGAIAQMNSSWAVRVYRDDLFVLQVDGTHGSAVADLRTCRTQHRANTPKPVWNPDAANPISFRQSWTEVPDNESFDNGFKRQWEKFLLHVAEGAPFPHTFWQGARGVQLAEAGIDSWRQRRWINMPAPVDEPSKKDSSR
jgi:predicted dehydrogenase